MDIKTMSCRRFIRQNFKKSILSIIVLLLCRIIFSANAPVHFSIAKKEITPSHIQLVLNTNRFFVYKTLSLSKPNRIVFDILNAQLKEALPNNLNHSFLTQMRKGQYLGKYLRLVFESNNAILVRTYLKKQSSNQYQWIIDLYSKSGHSTKNVIETLPLKVEKITSTKSIHKNQSTLVPQSSHPKLRDTIIVIDPGHGGKDPGAIGRYGIQEKNIVLQISKKLCALINKQQGFKAILTRSTDRYLTLRQRLSIARHYKPDLFIAIHADAYKNKKAKGVSVFALSQHGATSEAARWLASRENQSELAGGLELSSVAGWLKSIMINLSQNASIRISVNVGSHLLKKLKYVSRLHHDRIDQAAFVVLKSPDIPSLLIETVFISNATEEKRLRSSAYQHQLAQAIQAGIKEYFMYNPSRETWLSAIKHATTYYVSSGDTLSMLARRFDTSVKFLMELNHLSSTQLQIGQKLFVL